MAERIPTEILSHIFSFLRVSDRKEASLVCSRWYEASMDPKLARDVIYIYSHGDSLNSVYGLQNRTGLNLILDSAESANGKRTFSSPEFLEFAQNLNSLALRNFDLSANTLVKLLSHCNNLTSLDLSNCEGLFMTGQFLNNQADRENLKLVLSRVKELNLGSNRHLSNGAFNQVVSVLVNLKKFSVSGCQIVFHTHMYYKSTPASMAVFTFNNLLSYIKQNASEIKSIDLSSTKVTDEALQMLAAVPNLLLEELQLINCKEVTSEGIKWLCERQTELRVLDLQDSVLICDQSVTAIVQHLLELRALSLSNCRKISDNSINLLQALPKLQRVSLASCYQLTSCGLILGLCSRDLWRLTRLNISGCGNIGDAFVWAMCSTLVNLTHLDLSSCFGVGNIGIGLISKNLTGLCDLRLASCPKIGDEGLLGLLPSKNDKHFMLEHDGLCRCTRQHVSHILNLPKADEPQVNPTTYIIKSDIDCVIEDKEIAPLSNLKHLQYLDLTACVKISDRSLKLIMRFQELRVFLVAMNQNVSDDCLGVVSQHNPSIEELSLSQCARITEIGVKLITTKLPRLTSFNISGNDHVTDKTIDAIQMNCTRLKFLDVSFCKNISMAAVERLEGSMKHLQVANKRIVGK